MKVCFTGHRKIATDSLTLKRRLREELCALIEKGADEFIAGGALGFDTIAAITVLGLKKEYPHIKLSLYIPCPEQDIKWNEDEKALYRDILKSADNVKCISDFYTDTCMRERNKAMVEEADVCIAYHDGRVRSGTAMTVNYAKKKGIEIINLY